MSNQSKSTKIAVEIIGWYGAVAILCAYTLISFNVIQSNSLPFQLLNLSGAIGLLIISAYKKVFPNVALNIVWIVVAIITIASLIFLR